MASKALGAIILVVGIFLFMVGNQMVNEGQSITGKAERALSDDARQQYQAATMMRAGGLGGAALGAVLLLIGLAGSSGSTSTTSKTTSSREDPSHESDTLQENESKNYCPSCGEKVDNDQDYCSKCGQEL